MPIWMMVSDTEKDSPNVKRVDDFSGHETGRVNHDRHCPHAREYDMSGKLSPECFTGWNAEHGACGVMGPLYIRQSHDGLVLALRERNGYDDSDFFAIVWNSETGKPEEIEYASTRGWSYPNNAAVDATPEVLAAYQAYKERLAAASRERHESRMAKVPSVGKRVVVARGRKVPIGTEGEVFWLGRDSYARDYSSGLARGMGLYDALHDVEAGLMRVGLRTADGRKVFTNAKNVDLL